MDVAQTPPEAEYIAELPLDADRLGLNAVCMLRDAMQLWDNASGGGMRQDLTGHPCILSDQISCPTGTQIQTCGACIAVLTWCP